MKSNLLITFFSVFLAISASAKEIALTFDDAPGETTLHFTPEQRTDELIRKLNALDVPPVIIFANPCNGGEPAYIQKQLQKFKDNHDIIGNHTCSHPRLDDVGFERFVFDTEKAENMLGSLLQPKKLFRFPYFNEGNKVELRDQVRKWLKDHDYKNIPASVDNEDPIFSAKINDAKSQGEKINYGKVKSIFLEHILSGAEYAERIAVKNLGYSPKHVILLHQKDATVLFIDDLVKEFRKRGWKIISASEAIKDPLYSIEPKNTLSTYGLLAQVVKEKTGDYKPSYDFNELKKSLNEALGLK